MAVAPPVSSKTAAALMMVAKCMVMVLYVDGNCCVCFVLTADSLS